LEAKQTQVRVQHIILIQKRQLPGRLRSHVRAQVPVKRRRRSSLLHVAQHVLADAEEVAALLREDAVDEVGRVLRVSLLVPHDQSAVDLAELHLTL